ncbi:MAG TPA: hypothetical protein VFG09_14205 [Thermodesulfovibrionales bacterium]|jgi:hypothetical protein|nr:hypothetical protein [Thermodesulfovibrionales bacterium]
MNYITRAYRPGDEEKIIEMFNEVFHQNLDLSHWYWKYRDNPYGSYVISLATTEDGVLAAHYAGYPVKLSCSLSPGSPPVEIMTYQLGDKMTRRTFRSVGFGRKALIARTYVNFKAAHMKNGIPFAYGFAAHHSFRFGVVILNYADIEPVPYRRMPFDALKRLKTGRIRNLISPIRVEEVSEIDDEWTDFFSSVAPFFGCLTKREALYLRWRYLQRPGRRYHIIAARRGSRLAGWSVFFREQNRIIWGDALCRPKDADCVKVLLAHLRRHQVSDGAEFIECWFPPRPLWFDAVLKELGFEIGNEPNGLHFVAPIVIEPQSPEMLKKYFYYTMGDSDLF